MKKITVISLILTLVLILNLGCTGINRQPTVIQHENDQITYTDISNIVLPEDFSFSFTWGTNGRSSYDSLTGKLVKEKDAENVNKYTSYVLMSENELKVAYKYLLEDIDIFSYPNKYDPYFDPNSDTHVKSSPSNTIIVYVTANGKTFTVNCTDMSCGAPYCEEAINFVEATENLEMLITSFPEWQAFPDYEVGYM